MSESPSLVVGRYVLHAAIARGGMATIHLARLLGAEGWSRMVAAKRLHPQFTEDADFLAMFLDEARIASKVHHPNVVPVLDVVHTGAEVILVQEYVHGVPLDRLLRQSREKNVDLPAPVVTAIAADMLAGLHAAHEARDELGVPLDIVHRDVSPQNVIVGVDGIARLLDFGVAKASVNAHVTRAGTFKGKLNYTSPEQMRGECTRSTDIYAAAVVLWEALSARRMHQGRSEAEICAAVTAGLHERLLDVVDPAGASPERWAELSRLDPVVDRGLALAAVDRWATALEMGEALVAAVPRAPPEEVSRWVKRLGEAYLAGREKLIVTEESTWRQHISLVPETDPGSPARVAPREGETAGTFRPSALPLRTPGAPRRDAGSGASSDQAHPVAARSRRFEWAVALGILLVAGLLVGVLVVLVRHPAEPALAAQPLAAVPLAFIPPPTTTVIVEATAAPSAQPTADAGKPPPRISPAFHAAAPPRGPAAAPAPAPRQAAAAPGADCNPPFFYDGKKKVFKAGCL